jgi:hypothetical protein
MMYEIHRGALPIFQGAKGKRARAMVLDHLCRNRWCVNPWHLELVEFRENILRGNGAAAVRGRRGVKAGPRMGVLSA